jgi:hypothetical protein
MILNPQIEAALEQIAWRYNADLHRLRSALSHESAAELAQALGLPAAAAEERMARARRALTVQSDWGAGCKLLTDDVQAELLAAIADW